MAMVVNRFLKVVALEVIDGRVIAPKRPFFKNLDTQVINRKVMEVLYEFMALAVSSSRYQYGPK